VKHIVNNDVSAGMATLNSVNSDGLDLRQFNRELVEYLRGLLLVKTGSSDAVDVTAEDLTELKDLAAKVPELALVDCVLPSVEKKEDTIGQTEDEFRQPSKPVISSVASSSPQQPATEPETPATPQPLPAERMPAISPELASETERLRLNWRRIIEEAPADIKRTNAIAQD